MMTEAAGVAWRRLFLYHAAVLIISGASLWISYGPLSSNAWIAEYSHTDQGLEIPGDRLEFLRSLGFVLAVLVLYRILQRETLELWPARGGFLVWKRFTRTEKLWFVASILGVTAYILVLAPASLSRLQAESLGSDTWLEAYFTPYLAYFPYALCNYILLGLPLIILLLRSVRRDLRDGARRDREIVDFEATVPDWGVGELEAQALKYESDLINFEINRREVGTKYVLCVAVFVLYFFGELITNVHETLNPMAQDAMKSAIWIFAIAAIAGIIRLAWRYSSRTSKAKRAVRSILERAQTLEDVTAQKEVIKLQERLSGDLAPIAFAGRILKSGSFAALVLSILAPAITTWLGESRDEALRTIFPSFIANPIVDVLNDLLGR